MPPTRPLTQHCRGTKILIQLCSGFDGFWLGSTLCLASNAAHDRAGWAESERDTGRQPPACPKISWEFALAAAKKLPWAFIYPLVQQTSCSTMWIRPVFVWFLRAALLHPPLLHSGSWMNNLSWVSQRLISTVSISQPLRVYWCRSGASTGTAKDQKQKQCSPAIDQMKV